MFADSLTSRYNFFYFLALSDATNITLLIKYRFLISVVVAWRTLRAVYSGSSMAALMSVLDEFCGMGELFLHKKRQWNNCEHRISNVL